MISREEWANTFMETLFRPHERTDVARSIVLRLVREVQDDATVACWEITDKLAPEMYDVLDAIDNLRTHGPVALPSQETSE